MEKAVVLAVQNPYNFIADENKKHRSIFISLSYSRPGSDDNEHSPSFLPLELG
jgi:hypothetical protein